MVSKNSTQPLIEIKNLRKVYQTPAGDFTAVNGINVEVQRGEFVAIIGKSGSGKSTFINMITGIDRPTSGEIVIDGRAVNHDLSGRGTIYACDHINESGFSASRFPNDGNKFPSLHFHIDAVHSREITR